MSLIGLSADVATLQDNGNGTFTVTTAPSYSGPVELTYSVSDGLGGPTAGSQMFVVAPSPVFVDTEAAGTFRRKRYRRRRRQPYGHPERPQRSRRRHR